MKLRRFNEKEVAAVRELLPHFMVYYTHKENALEWLVKGVKDRCASSTCLPVAVGSRRASSESVMPLSPLWRE